MKHALIIALAVTLSVAGFYYIFWAGIHYIVAFSFLFVLCVLSIIGFIVDPSWEHAWPIAIFGGNAIFWIAPTHGKKWTDRLDDMTIKHFVQSRRNRA